ncbi:MAG: hypothetical protein J6T55_01510 [Alphaproteobacteria bacterium]|nr:hypothetical protein [Alphaproteobacteria bacterium]
MQNKYIITSALLMALFLGTGAQGQTLPGLGVEAGMENSLSDVMTGTNQRKPVDFPARSSLDSLELAPLPGIYETNMPGPQPMAESVSVNDLPSEKLLGRLTPEIFQEMAELERDAAYLELQNRKQNAKNSLEAARAQYRQARLTEIEQREKLVRERIQWWQEQEKLRQEAEKERQEAEDIKNQMAETEALKAQLEGEKAARDAEKEKEKEVETLVEQGENEEIEPVEEEVRYALVDVKGTRGNLTARVKNLETDEISTVKVGDTLNGEVITSVSFDTVIMDRKGIEYIIRFPSV